VLKARLKEMLAEPLIARGVLARYITSGSRPIVDDLLAGETHEMLLGLKKAEAGSELVWRKQSKKHTKKQTSTDEERGTNIDENTVQDGLSDGES